MAMTTGQIKLPVSVATEIVNKAKDTSTIASLSPSTPQIFTDADYLVFNGKSEAEVVAEGAVKSSYEQTVDSVVAKRFRPPPASPANSSGPTRTTSCRSSAASRPTRPPRWAARSTTWSTMRSIPRQGRRSAASTR